MGLAVEIRFEGTLHDTFGGEQAVITLPSWLITLSKHEVLRLRPF